MRKNMAFRTDGAAESERRAGSGSGIWGAAASGIASQRLGALIRLMWGAFLLLTSLYCLLAFLPYTYYAVIKALPYAWMAWFVRHHAPLFWLTAAAAAAVYRRGRNRTLYLASFGFLACAGVFLLFRPFLADIGNDRTAFWAGIAALWAIVLVVSLCDLPGLASAARDTRGPGHLSYVTAAWLAAAVVLVSVAGTRIDASRRSFHPLVEPAGAPVRRCGRGLDSEYRAHGGRSNVSPFPRPLESIRSVGLGLSVGFGRAVPGYGSQLRGMARAVL
jgi:hypothetical protein